jgi:hypothetical protein
MSEATCGVSREVSRMSLALIRATSIHHCIDSEEIATFTLPPALAMMRSV